MLYPIYEDKVVGNGKLWTASHTSVNMEKKIAEFSTRIETRIALGMFIRVLFFLNLNKYCYEFDLPFWDRCVLPRSTRLDEQPAIDLHSHSSTLYFKVTHALSRLAHYDPNPQ